MNNSNSYKLTFREFLQLEYEEKLKYLWAHHRSGLIFVFAAVILLALLFGCVKVVGKTTAMAGVTVNVELSEQAKTYLTDGYKAIIAPNSQKEQVYLAHTAVEDLAAAADHDENYYTVMSLTSLCNTQELDYLILDQEGFEVMLMQDIYLDLQEVYTQEELDALGALLVTAQSESEAAPKPIALKITDCPFIRENTQEPGEIYFVYAAGSPRTEACRDLLDYLLAWEKESA